MAIKHDITHSLASALFPRGVLDDTSSSQNESCGLLNLPLEIREKIYTYLLDYTYNHPTVTVPCKPCVNKNLEIITSTSLPTFQPHIAILNACKQIHLESSRILYSSNLFTRLTLYNDDLDGAIYFLNSLGFRFLCTNIYEDEVKEEIEDDNLSDDERFARSFIASTPHAFTPSTVSISDLSVQALDVTIIQNGSECRRSQVILPVAHYTRLLEYIQDRCANQPEWARERTVHVDLRHRYRAGPGMMEEILLEPWRNMRNFWEAVVGTDIVFPEYARALEVAMRRRIELEEE